MSGRQRLLTFRAPCWQHTLLLAALLVPGAAAQEPAEPFRDRLKWSPRFRGVDHVELLARSPRLMRGQGHAGKQGASQKPTATTRGGIGHIRPLERRRAAINAKTCGQGGLQ